MAILLNLVKRGWSCEDSDVMRRWGYLDEAQSVDCDCGEPQTMAHPLSCRLLDETCTAEDLSTVTERAKACAPAAPNGNFFVKDTKEEEPLLLN